MNTYAEWEKAQEISPSSPEAYYAELAWNAALATLTDPTKTLDEVVERCCIAAYNACDMGDFPGQAVAPDSDRRFVRAALAAAGFAELREDASLKSITIRNAIRAMKLCRHECGGHDGWDTAIAEMEAYAARKGE